MSNMEQTLSIIKPDAVERNLDNEIKEMFLNKGFSFNPDVRLRLSGSHSTQPPCRVGRQQPRR